MSINLERQSGLIPTEVISTTAVAIVGAGAIGSHVAECLAKIGISTMEAWDYDTVESHNLANQGFYLTDVGQSKVKVLEARLKNHLGVDFTAHVSKITGDSKKFSQPVVVSAVDSMASRKDIWEIVKRCPSVQLFIDARMGAMYGQIYAVLLTAEGQVEKYEKTLFDDSDGYEAPCTEKATVFCAQGMSAWIASIVADYAMSEPIHNFVEVDFARKTTVGVI